LTDKFVMLTKMGFAIVFDATRTEVQRLPLATSDLTTDSEGQLTLIGRRGVVFD